MAGNPLSDFNDFVAGTGSNAITDPKKFVIEGVENAYFLGRLMDPAKANVRHLSGGENIQSFIAFQDNGSFEAYLPGADHTWENPQRLDTVQTEWRYTMAHMSWVEQEIINNSKIAFGTGGNRFQQFVDIRNSKEALMWTAKWNGLEQGLWRQPDTAEMEGTGSGATRPMSIPAWINEEANGLWGQQGSSSETAWTTKGTVDPTAASVDGRFAPQLSTYSTANLDVETNLFAALDDMYMDVSFERPRTMQQYWESDRLNKQMIVTTKRGRRHIMFLLREGQDHFVAGNQDSAYSDPQFQGIPIERANRLETELLYEQGNERSQGAGEYVSELDALADDIGPRFYFINGNYLFPVFHQDRYFYKHEVTKHHTVPDTWVCPVATWYNIHCSSMQRQGLVSPSGSVITS